MSRCRILTLVDPDLRRRAALCFALGREGWYVEPHESVSELSRSLPRGGALLVADERGLLAAVRDCVAPLVLPLIAFQESPEPQRIVGAVREGAAGYLAWPICPAELARAIAMATAGEAGSGPRDPLGGLTTREREVLEAAATGLTSQRIAQVLSISRRTVDVHRGNLLTKMGVGSVSEAVRLARRADPGFGAGRVEAARCAL